MTNQVPITECQGRQREVLTAVEALYVHVPFCFHKCHYCDFYSLVDQQDRQATFTDRLIDEMRCAAERSPLTPRTIFVGGGTPTLLRIELWQRLLAAMRDLQLVNGIEEFTVEANPETVTAELLDVLVAGGVNRISIGAQSSNHALLKTLERWHDPSNVSRAVRLARAAGLSNINLDHIFAIPGQTMAMLDADIDTALALDVEHLSYYGLTYEPNTAMTQRLKQGQFQPLDESLERDMYARVMEQLAAGGYEHYEISNWAKPGRRCAHNLIYWRSGNWLGVGPSAASHLDGRRWKNAPHLGRYLAESTPSITDEERLSPDQRLGERLMMGLRLREGVALSIVPEDDPRRAAIDELADIGMLTREQDRLRLTGRGLFVADAVMARLL